MPENVMTAKIYERLRKQRTLSMAEVVGLVLEGRDWRHGERKVLQEAVRELVSEKRAELIIWCRGGVKVPGLRRSNEDLFDRLGPRTQDEEPS